MLEEIDQQPSKSRFAYVGAYTTHRQAGKGNGLNVFLIEPAAGQWTHVQLLKDIVDPSFLAMDYHQRFLYCVHESLGEVSAFAIDQQTGLLEHLNTQSTGGQSPAHLSLDPTNRFVVVANYSSGSVAVLPVGKDGKLEPLNQLTVLEGPPGPDKVEQAVSHPHAIQFSPDGRFLLVPDKGFDRIFNFKFDAAGGRLEPNDPPFTPVTAGAGPRHLAFHPGGAYAYLINELNSTLTSFSYNSIKGILEPLQTVSTLPPDFTGHSSCAEISVSGSGRFVYGSNRGHDSIVSFSIDEATGQVKLLEWVSTRGHTPRFFTLSQNDKILFAANQDSSSIISFRVEPENGQLIPAGGSLAIGSPVCILFA